MLGVTPLPWAYTAHAATISSDFLFFAAHSLYVLCLELS